MNQHKLNALFWRHYKAESGGESDDDYEPSQLLTPTKKRRYDELLSQECELLPPRSSALASMEANEHIGNSGVIDDDVGSQQFLKDLFALRGLESSIFDNPTNNNDGASDIDKQEFEPESQKLELYGSSPPEPPSKDLPTYSLYQIKVDTTVEIEEDPQVQITDFCPHSHTACPCAAWLFEQHQQLNHCLKLERQENEQLIAQNFRQKVRLQRTREVLQKALNLLDPAHVKDRERLLGIEVLQKETTEALEATRQELEKARTAQKVAEQRLELANRVRHDIIRTMQASF